jgi:hypothetical protein
LHRVRHLQNASDDDLFSLPTDAIDDAVISHTSVLSPALPFKGHSNLFDMV